MPSSAVTPAGPDAFPNNMVFAGPPGTGTDGGSLDEQTGQARSRASRSDGRPPGWRGSTGCGDDGFRALVWLMKTWTPGALISTVELTGSRRLGRVGR